MSKGRNLKQEEGRSGRSARRRRLLAVLSKDAPAWDPAGHPGIDAAGGAAAWVKKKRRETDKASRRLVRHSLG